VSTREKRRKSIIDELFGRSMFDETDAFLSESPESGYSISVTQTPEGTKVRAKVRKDADASALRRQLQQKYPNAEIEIEGGKKEPLIREISTKLVKEETRENRKNKK
jgi:hypothetical protein